MLSERMEETTYFANKIVPHFCSDAVEIEEKIDSIETCVRSTKGIKWGKS